MELPKIILPTNSPQARRIKIMQWFRDIDAMLARLVDKKHMGLDHAQTYFRMKVEKDPYLAIEDKQQLANESQLWKIPNTKLEFN